jgi:hypothetical protein
MYVYSHTHKHTHYVSGAELPASFLSGSFDLRADRLWLTVHVSRCRCRMLRFTCQSWFKQFVARTSLREMYVIHTADQPACHYAVDPHQGDPALCHIQNKEIDPFSFLICLFLPVLCVCMYFFFHFFCPYLLKYFLLATLLLHFCLYLEVTG